jgi:hypothetical protein
MTSPEKMKRYEPHYYEAHDVVTMETEPDGDYVLYSDHRAAIEEKEAENRRDFQLNKEAVQIADELKQEAKARAEAAESRLAEVTKASDELNSDLLKIIQDLMDADSERECHLLSELSAACEKYEKKRYQDLTPAATGTCDTSNLAAARKEKE